jgi:hypothetical protein
MHSYTQKNLPCHGINREAALIGGKVLPDCGAPSANLVHKAQLACVLLPAVILLVIGTPQIVAARLGRSIPLPDKDREMLDTYLGKGVVGQAVEAMPLMDPLKWMPLKKNTWRYRMTYGKWKGQTIDDRISPLERHASGADWKMEIDKTEILYLQRTPSGDIECVSHTDLDTGLDSANDPPEPHLTQGLKPGQSIKKHFSVKVNDPSEPSKVKYSGDLDLTLTYVGAYKIATPAGTFEAVLTRSICKGKVGPANVVDVRYQLFAQDVGMVAMAKDNIASAYLFFGTSSKIGKVLVEIPQKAATEAPATASKADQRTQSGIP